MAPLNSTLAWETYDGSWQGCSVHGVMKSWTQLSYHLSLFTSHALEEGNGNHSGGSARESRDGGACGHAHGVA